ncbi:hypothetical protein EYF80_033794 [Liparis tanakae]|uniref:Uncharacterized protein n=1 Tax=Liparis tanakae TaxID=230148 RepID=A0A4Z2GRI6_9TELE|nr:hypothetical protein EYF80_033794 [Liparis tanakae]
MYSAASAHVLSRGLDLHTRGDLADQSHVSSGFVFQHPSHPRRAPLHHVSLAGLVSRLVVQSVLLYARLQLIEARCLRSGSEPRSAAARCSPQQHVTLSLRVA